MHKSHLFDPQENAYAFDLIDHVILNSFEIFFSTMKRAHQSYYFVWKIF